MYKKTLRTIAALAFVASVSQANAMGDDDVLSDEETEYAPKSTTSKQTQEEYDKEHAEQDARNREYDFLREHQQYNARVQDSENRRNEKK